MHLFNTEKIRVTLAVSVRLPVVQLLLDQYNCGLHTLLLLYNKLGLSFFTDRICVALQHTESVTAQSTCLIRDDVKVEVFLKEMHS